MDGMTISFFVEGVPAPGGSKKFKGFNRHTGKAVIVDDCDRNTRWREVVAWRAKAAMSGRNALIEPLSVIVAFIMPRPKTHYDKRAEIREWALLLPHIIRPDATKLWRAAEDAGTGILWADDSQIIQQTITKRYHQTGEKTGVHITITA